VFYAHGGFGGAAPGARQQRFLNDVQGFARILEVCRQATQPLVGASVGIAPHSLRAVTPQELSALLQLGSPGVVHLHIAEQIREVEECVAWSGRRPIEWLIDSQPVGSRWCLVHATHATASELEAIAACGAVVGLCPITESSLGDGIFAAAELRARGGRFGIGSDSNIQLDDVALNPRGLVRGAWFDVVTLAANHPVLLERRGDELLDSWIFAGGRELIDCVWRAGERVVSGGRHRDRDALIARYGRALRTLRA